jgi:DNA repair protein SbcD/Mre11
MRIYFYTDTQLSGQTPRHRVDNYQKSLLDKIEEVYTAAKKGKADFLICGGDFFNSHRIFSYELLNRTMDILCDSGLDTYMVIGQHDLLGYNPTTYKSSTLAFVVERCPSLRVVWEPVDLGDVTISASHVWDEVMDAGKTPVKDGAFNILIAHHLLTSKKAMFDVVNTTEFATKCQLDGGNYDLVLSGDLHEGYPVHEVNGMWFCNPGSLARQAINDRERTPQYAVIEAEPNQIPIIDVVPIKCALPGSDVFGESAVELMRTGTKFDPTAFVEEIGDFEAESSNVHDLVQKIGKSKGIRTEVLAYLATKAQHSS